MGPRSTGDDEPRYSPEFAKSLGRAIKVKRTDLGIHRRELAERAGISYSYITEIENGNKPPSASRLEPIARALGMRMSELIQEAERRQDAAEMTQEQPAAFQMRWPQSPPALFVEEPSLAPERLDLLSAGPRRSYAMRPSMRGPNRNLRAALMELEELLPTLPPEDVERLLDFARRLAR